MGNGEKDLQGKHMNLRLPVIGILLILAGIFFLFGSFIPEFNLSKLWPLFMLIPVLIFAQLLLEKKKEAVGVLVPGGILLYLTVYFLWLNFTSWSNSDATWPHYMLAPAFGLFCLYLATRNSGLLIPVFVLTVLAVLFFGGIYKSSVLIAVFFIGLGVIILIRPLFKKRNS